MLVSLKESFLKRSGAARAGLAAGAAAIVMLFALLSWWALASDYQILFAGLAAEDAAAIVAELDRMKVAHRLEDEGKSILVERGDVYKTRLKLMSKGVNLKGTIGFEIFNDSNFGMTDFAQKVSYQRALQGEIARTVMGLSEVQSARVHLVMPESGLFRKGDGKGKASITISTHPGHQLSPEQVLGIQRLVAAAVPQIEPAAVTVLDSKGVTQSRATDGDAEAGNGAAGSNARLELKRQTEQYLIQKAALVLDKAVGPGRAIVSVDVVLDHDVLKTTNEQVVPAADRNGGEGAVLRKKISTQKDSRARPAGMTPAPDPALAGGVNQNELMATEVEYLHGRRIEQIVSTAGSIKRISVGVVLPSDLALPKLGKLTEVISMAVGLNRERGDGIAIYSLDQYAAVKPAQQQLDDMAGNLPHQAAPPALRASSVQPDQAGPERFYMIIGTLIGFSLIALLTVLRLRSHKVARLGSAERAQLLNELQSWLSQAPPAGKGAMR